MESICRRRRERKNSFLSTWLLELGVLSSSLDTSGSSLLELNWNCITSSPGSPACGGQMMKLLSLYSKPIPHGKSLPTDISCWFCFSGEPWVIHGLIALVSGSMFRRSRALIVLPWLLMLTKLLVSLCLKREPKFPSERPWPARRGPCLLIQTISIFSCTFSGSR